MRKATIVLMVSTLACASSGAPCFGGMPLASGPASTSALLLDTPLVVRTGSRSKQWKFLEQQYEQHKKDQSSPKTGQNNKSANKKDKSKSKAEKKDKTDTAKTTPSNPPPPPKDQAGNQDAPAGSVLLPYFEVDLNDPNKCQGATCPKGQ